MQDKIEIFLKSFVKSFSYQIYKCCLLTTQSCVNGVMSAQHMLAQACINELSLASAQHMLVQACVNEVSLASAIPHSHLQPFPRQLTK